MILRLNRNQVLLQAKHMIKFLEKKYKEDRENYIQRKRFKLNSSWLRKFFKLKQLTTEEVIDLLNKNGDDEWSLFYHDNKAFSKQYTYCQNIIRILDQLEDEIVELSEDNLLCLGY